ncbi:uncharacterized protein LOC117642836 [Thrips palmi]|uniref:Uncharacterized protein LOC117642836 n=1 Tax=Thrips palmi TaxID=161013 RepID=A0A6P8YTB5_THRPL|nr:uncharacterized protein LOC117642836 [Thrips palmi]
MSEKGSSSQCSLVALGQCDGPSKSKGDFTDEEWLCLKKHCIDPYQKHEQKVAGVRVITVDEYLSSKAAGEEVPFKRSLIPGQKLCMRCTAIIVPILASYAPATATPSSDSSSQNESRDLFSEDGNANVPSSGDLFIDDKLALETLNQSIKPLNEGPMVKRKMETEPSYVPRKLKRVYGKLETLAVQSGTPSSFVRRDEETDFGSKVLAALQDKFKNSKSNADKMSVLSVALAGFNPNKVLELFQPVGATDWMIRKTAALTKEQGMFPTAIPKKASLSISDETLKLVLSHYESEANSRQLPGKKDCVIIREAGKEKQYVQKKLILCNLKELFRSFKEENPLSNISFSKFASLRPAHCVLARSAGTHSVCVCKHHENVKLLMEGANFKSFDESLVSYKDFISTALCPTPSATCFLERCKDCPGFEQLEDHLHDILSENFIENVTYKQWTEVDRSTLETHCQETGPFLEAFIAKLEKLAPHHFINKQQSQYLKDLKENLGPDEAITICDFSENYSFIIQDSVQGHYFNNDQATIHPFVTYYKKEGELKVLSFVIISDHMKHGTTAFYAFQKKHVEFLRTHIPNLKKMHYFSDGAASQYKNVFNMINLSYHEQDFFGIKAEWHFFATSHGKGPSDGVGGAIKRCAARASIQGTLISTPLEMYKWAKDAMPTMNVCYVSTQEVIEAQAFLAPRFNRALQINQIRSHHRFLPVSVGELVASRFSSSDESVFAPAELIRKIPSFESVDVGDYIAVHSKGRTWCVAQVTNTDVDTQSIMAVPLEEIKKPGSIYYYLSDNIEEPVQLENVLAKVDIVKVANKPYFMLSITDKMRVRWQLLVINSKKLKK